MVWKYLIKLRIHLHHQRNFNITVINDRKGKPIQLKIGSQLCDNFCMVVKFFYCKVVQ